MSSAKNRFTHKLYSVYVDVFQSFLSKSISNTHKRTSKRNSRLPSSKNRVLDGVHFRSEQKTARRPHGRLAANVVLIQS